MDHTRLLNELEKTLGFTFPKWVKLVAIIAALVSLDLALFIGIFTSMEKFNIALLLAYVVSGIWVVVILLYAGFMIYATWFRWSRTIGIGIIDGQGEDIMFRYQAPNRSKWRKLTREDYENPLWKPVLDLYTSKITEVSTTP